MTVNTIPLAVDPQQVSNGAKETIESGMPYRIMVQLTGSVPLLFHSWNIESIAEKASAAKGSTAKKTDDLESYVYRDNEGNLGIPGVNLAAAMVNAARSLKDPRSPRKGLQDLTKAGIMPLTIIAPFEPLRAKWDYEDARRVTIQRAGVTRIRPAMREGWVASFELLIATPEYFPPKLVLELLNNAGRLVGLCDFRPTFGRFQVTRFEILTD